MANVRSYLALFYTHTGAVKFNRYCVANGFPAEMMPVPRVLSSSCGICVRFSTNDDVRPMLAADTASIYEIVGKEFTLVCENDIQ